jgi:hypothetical protein
VQSSTLGTSIDFFDQGPSQEACRAASASGTSCTIDLSSASDRMSTWLVQRIFRSNPSLLRMLVATRTRFLAQDDYADLPSITKLRKFASMGSALTFPVQSIVFTCLAIGVGKYLHRDLTLKQIAARVRVFGDDIVVPSSWIVPLTRLLTACGLKVNGEKSFSSGFFRESCGLYAYEGYTVTPFRIRHILRGVDGASRVSWAQGAYNAHLMGLWHTSAYMERQVAKGLNLPTVPVSAPPVGMPTFSKGEPPNLRVKWDSNLQQEVVTVIGFRLKTKAVRADDGINSLLRLANAGYRTRLTLADFMDIPKTKSSFVHEFTDVVDGPAYLKRVRVPRALIYG